MLDWIYSALWALFTSYLIIRLYNGIWVVARMVYVWYILPKHDLSPYKNLWTVVTGCTDGIGKAYTVELARRGMRKFLLIGRNPYKLKHVADILMNCAGVAVKYMVRFTEQETGSGSDILRVNLMSTVKMIELVLPGMVDRDRGIVVNVASITGWRPLPFMSTYPASKAAITFFTDALYDEYKNTKVKIQCLLPFLVATKMIQSGFNTADGFMVISPEYYAKDAVDAIGYHSCTGSRVHELQIALGAVFSFRLFKLLFYPLLLHMSPKPNEDLKKCDTPA